jgi:hypothetical protein
MARSLRTFYRSACRMIRNALVRSIEVMVIALAAYAFFFLPVGRRTPWGHLSAIFSTPPAREAAEDVAATGKAMRDKMFEEVRDAGVKR